MIRIVSLFFLISLVSFCIPSVSAQQQERRFIDIDGDGFTDNLPDNDIDGIPDNIDPDHSRSFQPASQDLSGSRVQAGKSWKKQFLRCYQFRRKLSMQTSEQNFMHYRFRMRTDLFDYRIDRRSYDGFRRIGRR